MHDLKLKVHTIVGHRNGISGKGFYAVTFSYTEDHELRNAVATVDYEDVESFRTHKLYDPGTRVLMFKRDGTGLDINETMRGDYFHEALVKYLIKYENKQYQQTMKQIKDHVRA